MIDPSRGAGTAALTEERIIHLQGIVLLLRQLPNELLPIDATDFADLTVATAAIDLLVSRWSPGGRSVSIATISGEDVICVIRRVLKKCADEAPPAGTAGLLFIADQHVRDSMRQEVGAANSALQNAEWKAATVLGGAAIEAILHWRLSSPQTAAADLTTAKKNAISSRRLKTPPHADLDQWNLVDFIAVARELDIIEEKTFKQADTARDYRNFIHPGYAARQKQVCDRAAALAVLSGLEHIIRDLSR